jgi:hypothetical protein
MALNTQLLKSQGSAWWSEKLADGSYAQPVHLGNATAAVLNTASEKIEHRETQTGLEAIDETLRIRPTATIDWTLEDYSKRTIALVAGGVLTEVAAGPVVNEAVLFQGAGRHELSKLASAVSLVTKANGRALAPESPAIAVAMTASTGGGTRLLTAAAPHNIKTGYRVNVPGVGNFFAIEASATGIYLSLTQDGTPGATAELPTVDGTSYNVTVGGDYTAYPDKGYVQLTAGAFGGVPGVDQLLISYTAKAQTQVSGFARLNIPGKLTFEGINSINNKPFKIYLPQCNFSPAAARNLITSGNFEAFQMSMDVYYDAAIAGFYRETL